MSNIKLDTILKDGSSQSGSTDYAYTLEVKVPDPNNAGHSITKKVRLLVDWNEITNKPSGLGVVEFANYFKFPRVGNEQTLYVALDENRIYRYISSERIYRIIGSDWNEIDIIDCGGAE